MIALLPLGEGRDANHGPRGRFGRRDAGVRKNAAPREISPAAGASDLRPAAILSWHGRCFFWSDSKTREDEMNAEMPETAVVEVTLTGPITSQTLLESLMETGVRSAEILRARVTRRTHRLRIQLEGSPETLQRVKHTLHHWAPAAVSA
jgi:hypothetical protein